PNMSFPIFLGVLLLLCAALHKASRGYALAAGILGGLLFYVYIYYAVAWCAAIAFLTLLCIWIRFAQIRIALISLGATVALAVPFLLWTRSAARAGGYLYRSARLGMTYSHIPPKVDVA